MRIAAHEDISRPAVAVVGVWDPFLPAHRDLFRRLGDRARERSLASVAIVLDPNPSALLNGRSNWPVYHDLRARRYLMARAGLDAVLPVRFFRDDLYGTAQDFFDVVLRRLRIEELWIGARQTLGSGPAGARPAIADLAARHGIRLETLPEVEIKTTRKDVRRMLTTGCLRDAGNVVGGPPILSRPRSGTVRLAWCPGPYRVAALRAPDDAVGGPSLDVVLEPDPRGVSRLAWPDRTAHYLAVLAGPWDLSRANRPRATAP